jgi:1,2-diacylglycerol 3-beta-glucosyltransferase
MFHILALASVGVAGLVIAYGLLYSLVLSVLGIRGARRSGLRITDQEGLMDLAPDHGADLLGYRFFAVIPALNEEEVIGETVSSFLRDQPGATVVVVDDGSTDRTAEIVSSYEPTGRVILVRRVLPDAMQGKGKALNAGLEEVRRDVERGGWSSSHVIVVVMDADGRMTPNATAVVAREFDKNSAVGGLQLVVRIRNRDTWLTAYQDMEFWASSGITQLGRTRTGSVSLGGNGQFARLSALNEVGVEPWSDSLTEDLDLAISLAVRGWETVSTPWAYVTQQAVGDLKRLVRQRTRWYQGHMSAAARLPEMARSHMPNSRYLELALYVLMPWVTTLPWSLLQASILIQFTTGHPFYGVYDASRETAIGMLIGWYLVSFMPFLFWGVIYFRRARHTSLVRALVLTHMLLPGAVINFVAAWKAFGRILSGRRAWSKTRREIESPTPELVTQ